MSTALLIDFGSTYTKLRAVDLTRGRLIGSAQGPSTVRTDVCEGLQQGLKRLESQLGSLPSFDVRLASSSAAGGLQMVTVGLVPELTALAARQAALGAGAKIVGNFSYGLTRADVDKICSLAPDILLLSGGTDGGNAKFILSNAILLADSAISCPIIVAGNRDAADEVTRILRSSGKIVSRTANVMPGFGALDVEPAREAIRQVFIDTIVHAKGIDRARGLIDGVLMPTPVAVLNGAQLASEGTDDIPGFGPVLVVDPGGATTDVHSISEHTAAGPDVIMRGLPEPYKKRTVEGDIGMRHSIQAIVENTGLSRIARLTGMSPDEVMAIVGRFESNVDHVPVNPMEERVERTLANCAISLAVTRHAGRLELARTVDKTITFQIGKNLSSIETVIATGGVVAHSEDPMSMLDGIAVNADDPLSLKPKNPKYYIDKSYSLFACGLLAEVDRTAAMKLLKSSLELAPRRSRAESLVG